ncbi:hypothetical protein ACA910_006328 [Epithemia clementina (nom. ined.)]
MSLSSFSTSSSGGGSIGPVWEWNALFGREQESKFLQSLVQTKLPQASLQQQQQQQQEEEKHESEPSPAPLHPGATVLLHGPAGSGKSSLIQAQPSWHGWLLASGKFLANQEQFQQPFSALIEACNALIDLWVQHNDTVPVCQWSGFQTLLEEDVEFLRHILPKAYQAVQARTYKCQTLRAGTLESVLEQNALPTKEDLHQPQQLKRRQDSSLAMKQDVCTIDCVSASFVRVLSFLCQAQPVVLFLDDVQWADAASAKVLQVLATTASVDNLLLVLSYRDEEINSSGHMPATLTAIQEYAATQPLPKQPQSQQEAATISKEDLTATTAWEEEKTSLEQDTSNGENKTTATTSATNQLPQRRIYDMPISNLPADSVNALIASLTKRGEDETLPLAQVVHQKTAGNPFFVTQFLQMLRREQFLRYAFLTGQWEWGNVDQLQSAAHVSDNVADLIAATMERLPESTRVALKVAACLGKVIPLHVLIRWFDESFEAYGVGTACYLALHQVQLQGLQSILDHAVDVGILIRPNGQDAYMWAHDKLQAVAYSLIPLDSRRALHKKLGRTLWQMSQEEYPDEEWMVFMAADQMNRYSEYQQQEQQQQQGSVGAPEALGAEVATLCFEAARLSLAKSALYPAYEMLKAGIKHLNVPDKWKNHYELCLSLYSTVAEMAIQLGRKDEATEAVNHVQSNARSFEDKFRVQMVHLKVITDGQDRNYELGMQTAGEILKEYGVRIPHKFLPGMLTLECNKLLRRSPGGKMDSLLAMPDLTDKKTRNIIKLLLAQSIYALVSPKKKKNRNISCFSALRVLSIAIDKKAVCEETSMAIAFLGMSHGAEGRLKEASEYGEMALKLVNRFPQTVGSIHAMVVTAVTGGIFTHTKPLSKCLDLWLEGHHLGLRTGNMEKAGICILAYAFTYITCGLPLSALQSDLYQYEKEVVQFNLPGTILANYQIFQQTFLNLQELKPDPTLLNGDAMDQDKMLASFQGNAYRMTKRDIDTFRLLLAITYGKWDTAETLIGELEPFLEADQFYVRSAMRRTVMALAAFKISRSNGRRKLRLMARKILKDFNEALKKGNVNVLPLHTMLNAEESPSKEKYENAIRSCARLGLVHFEAYMCEQAGLYFLEPEQKDDEWAEFYLAQAVTLYADWGAHGKAQQLRTDHVRLLRSSLVRERANTALKGRSRYSSTHTDLLMDFDFERLSTSTINSTSSSLSRSLLASGTHILTSSSSIDSAAPKSPTTDSNSGNSSSSGSGNNNSNNNYDNNNNNMTEDKKHEETDETTTSTSDDSSELSEVGMGEFVYASPLS